MNKVPKNPFRIEELRAKLASSKKISELIKTYKRVNPEIKDLNTPKLWDSLNRRAPITRKGDPMTHDRLVSVTKLLSEENIKVLNIGFGAGDLETYVLKEDSRFKWCGVDISQASVKSAKKRFTKGIFKIGKIDELKFSKQFFDYVVILEVLEHVRPSKLFSSLKEVKRVLKREGKIIVSVPLNEGLEQMVKRGENPNAHVRVYTPELIEAELRIAGFKILWTKLLFAFHNYYAFKAFISRYLLPGIRKPNNIILLAQKP